jgi:hypothetical protein
MGSSLQISNILHLSKASLSSMFLESWQLIFWESLVARGSEANSFQAMKRSKEEKQKCFIADEDSPPCPQLPKGLASRIHPTCYARCVMTTSAIHSCRE